MSNNRMEHFLESTIQILPWIQDILKNGALDKPRETTVTSISAETLSNLSATSSTQPTTLSLGKTLNFVEDNKLQFYQFPQNYTKTKRFQ